MRISSKTLIIILFLLFNFNISFADINAINKVLNKNSISSSEINLNSKISNIKKVAKKSSNKPKAPLTINYDDNSPTIYKNLKINVNGTEKLIHVPFLNEKFFKKQKNSPTPKRIKDNKAFRPKSAPIRIGEGDADITIMPCPFNFFHFPPGETDELKIQAIADVKTIFDKVNSLTWENYGQTMQEIYKLAYEKIFPQYNKFPDICSMTRLYLTESGFKLSPQYFTSGTYLAQAYDQITTDYAYLSASNDNIKRVLDVINQRKSQMKENDKRLEAEIKSQLSYIENYKQNIEDALKIVHASNNQKEIDQHIQGIADRYSGISAAYNLIYNNYMMMGDETKAHEIFNFTIDENGQITMSGKFYDHYNQIPYSVPFKYKADNTELEIYVKQFKKAEDLLTIMKTYCQMETQNVKNQDFIENTNCFEDKVINHMCKFVEEFQPNESGVPPSTENPKGKAKELIDKAKLDEYHTYAYGWNAYPGTETFYKNKPAITKLYFSRVENVELTSADIPKPTERITLRADVDYNLPAPLYDFKIEIKSSISGRTKTIIMKKCQYGSSAYYAHFYPNETIDPKDDKINLINNERGALNPSVAAVCAEKRALAVPPPAYNNPFFKYKLCYSDTDGKLTIKNSASFLKSGGAECINSSFNNQKAEALIRNQANWIIFLGHGNPETGTIGEIDDSTNPNPVLIAPGKEKYDVITKTTIPGLINDNGISEYSENIDVLILSVCGVLNSLSNVKSWHKVLPDGVILGYSEDIYNFTANHCNTMFNDFLTNNIGKNLTKEEIASEWEKMNLKAYNDFNTIWTAKPFLREAGNYAYIINNEWHFGKIIKSVGTFRNSESLLEFVLSPIE